MSKFLRASESSRAISASDGLLSGVARGGDHEALMPSIVVADIVTESRKAVFVGWRMLRGE